MAGRSSMVGGGVAERWWAAATWISTAVLLFALLAVGGYIIWDLHRGRQPAFLEQEPPVHAAGTTTARVPGGLWIAGSGSNIPLTRGLAARFRGAASPVTVHRSIGSTGGLRALWDGAIDLAMISRPLKAAERRPGFSEIPYARVAVVIAAHAGVPDEGLSTAELLSIFRGERRSWSDGSRLVLLLREKGDSSHRAMGDEVPGFTEAVETAYRERLGRVVYSDLDMQSALLSIQGAVGLFDLGAVRSQGLPIKTLALDGVEPSVESLRDRRYRVAKDLLFLAAEPVRGPAGGFIDFVRSREGQETIRRSGYLPLLEETR